MRRGPVPDDDHAADAAQVPGSELRYGLLEAGHLGENAYLAATSMGLGACGVGAFMDDAINEMLGVDGVEEAAVYMLAAGRVAAAPTPRIDFAPLARRMELDRHGSAHRL